MPLKTPKEKRSAKEDKARLKGLRYCRVLGDDILVRPIKILPRIRWKTIRKVILSQKWGSYKNSLEHIFESAIQDWGELTYDDLWRDPEVAFYIYNEVIRG